MGSRSTPFPWSTTFIDNAILPSSCIQTQSNKKLNYNLVKLNYLQKCKEDTDMFNEQIIRNFIDHYQAILEFKNLYYIF